MFTVDVKQQCNNNNNNLFWTRYIQEESKQEVKTNVPPVKNVKMTKYDGEHIQLKFNHKRLISASTRRQNGDDLAPLRRHDNLMIMV